MANHEFGIIDNFEQDKKYSEYSPKEYNCIRVRDEYIMEINKYLSNLKTYHHKLSNIQEGFAYHGITIIPPKSLMLFHDIVVTLNKFKKSNELTLLASLILSAKLGEKHLIHFGI